MEESKAFVSDTVTRTEPSQPLPEEPEGGGERRSHKGLKLFLLLSLTILLAIGAVAAYAYYLNLPVDPTAVNGRMATVGTTAAMEVEFTVNRGESLDAVATRLAKAGLIRSAFLVKLVGLVSRTSGEIQAGHYLLSPGMTSAGIYRSLIDGKQVLVKVTIPEGFTMRQIAERLDSEGIVAREDFISKASDRVFLSSLRIPGKSAEGYLFPDTYLFPRDYPAKEVISHFVQNFFSHLKAIDPGFESMSPQQIFDKVTLGSIVEREYVSAEEAPLIASVFYNRLAAGVRLESCATVVYVMTEQDGLPHPDRLFYRDLDRPSPYNTYLHKGLPPGPISNPGNTALKAAFFPAKSKYWYFVLQSDGATHHHFSTTLSDHNQAAIFYLKTLSNGN